MTQYVYAGAAPFSGGSDPTQPGGLFRLAVGSNEWRSLTTGLPDRAEVRTIAIHPENPQIVYVGAQDGPYRSLDGGDHWERLNFPEKNLVVWSIVFDPKNPRTLYLGTAPPAIFKSEDGGESWRRLRITNPVGLVQMGFPCRIIRLAVDPTNTQEVYAGLEVGGVIRSVDGGETWDDCSPELIKFTQHEHLQSQLISDTNREGMMDSHALTVSAARPGTVFLATRMGLFCSEDKGMHWKEMEIWRQSPLAYARDIQVAPDNPN
ncbi:MAG TPA: YCF48-related protein, partial [Methylomirabilota bacterium]|nr:YCF48-related protein [Methylomirabilota bacterium]